jgi:hypothetical protein
MDTLETRPLYDRDFVLWTEAQAEALRALESQRPNAPVDWANLIDEVLDMGRNWLHGYESHVVLVVLDLLKLEHSPVLPPRNHWRAEVADHRGRAARLVRKAPSLRRRLDLEEAFAEARRTAVEMLRDDGVPASAIPETCPYDLDTQILAPDWFPANRHGHGA